MSDRAIEIFDIKLDDGGVMDDRDTEAHIIGEVSYNDGAMRRSTRGYWFRCYYTERGEGFWQTPLLLAGTDPNTNVMLESAVRYSAAYLSRMAEKVPPNMQSAALVKAREWYAAKLEARA